MVRETHRAPALEKHPPAIHPHVWWVAFGQHEVFNQSQETDWEPRRLLDWSSRFTARQDLFEDCVVQRGCCEAVPLFCTCHFVKESESTIHIPQRSSVGWLRGACPEETHKVLQRSRVTNFVSSGEPREEIAQESDTVPQRSCSSTGSQQSKTAWLACKEITHRRGRPFDHERKSLEPPKPLSLLCLLPG